MKRHFRLKRAAACIAGSAVMLSGFGAVLPVHVSAAGDCVIDTGKTYQIIRGFGGINHPEWAGDLTSSQRETAFGNGPDQLGFTMLRVFVNPDKNQWNKAVPTAKYASEHDVTVFASPWEPPSSLAESGNGNGKLHLPSRNYGAYSLETYLALAVIYWVLTFIIEQIFLRLEKHYGRGREENHAA